MGTPKTETFIMYILCVQIICVQLKFVLILQQNNQLYG